MARDPHLSKEDFPIVEAEEASWLRVMEVASLCCLPMALKAAINLDVFHILSNAASQSLTAEEIASHLPASNPNGKTSLDRLLCLLASHSILSCSVSQDSSHRNVRKYGLTSMCKFLVKNTMGLSLAPLVLMNQDKVFMEAWQYLQNGILEGEEPFAKAHGKDAFSYGLQDLRFDKLFNVAMSNHTSLTMKALLEKYDGFKEVQTLVDVGGGLGSCLQQIVSKYPHIKGINFDQPHVVEAAPKPSLLEHVGGDMFQSVPKGDAIFMKWILHDWGDEYCLKLLQNCYKALEEKGKVIAVESVLPVEPKNDILSRVCFQHDMLMLAYNPGGKERTEEEFQQLAVTAGFSGLKVVCQVNELNVLEFYKS